MSINNDPIVRRTRKLMIDYAAWWAAYPTHRPRARYTFNQLLMPFMTDLKRLGFNFAETRQTGQAGFRELNRYLESKGWAIEIGFGFWEKKPVPLAWMGRLEWKATGTVQRFDGTDRPYTAYLVAIESQALLKQLAVTIDSTVYLFANQLPVYAADLAAVYRQAQTAGGQPLLCMEPYAVAEFQNHPTWLINGQADLKAIQQAFLITTLTHELQHVRDFELQRQIDSPGLSGAAYATILGYSEARAELRALADGPIPFASLGNLVLSWTKRPDQYGIAARMIEVALGKKLTELPLIRTEFQTLARVGLLRLDRDYFDLLAVAREPDPLAALKRRREQR